MSDDDPRFPAEATTSPDKPTKSAELAGLTVLAVDDDPLILAVVRRVLVAAGARALEASGPTEAISALAAERVDLAIVDVTLQSEFSGLELCRHIRNTHPAIGVVVMTGLANAENKIAADHLGLRLLEKPWKNADVVRALIEAHERKPAPP